MYDLEVRGFTSLIAIAVACSSGPTTAPAPVYTRPPGFEPANTPHHVRGRIVDETRSPLAKVVVVIRVHVDGRELDDDYLAFTDARGDYALEVPAGSYSMWLFYDGASLEVSFGPTTLSTGGIVGPSIIDEVFDRREMIRHDVPPEEIQRALSRRQLSLP